MGIYIIGTGGFAKEVLCLIDDLNRYNDVIAFLELDELWEKNWKNKSIFDIEVLPLSKLDITKGKVVIGIGDPVIRNKVVSELPYNCKFETLIHPSVTVSKWVEMGVGNIICAGSILTCDIKLGNHIQLNLNTTVGHDCIIEDFCTTAPSTNISGNCEIGERVYFGTSSATKQGVKICDDAVIGMGAIVVKDIYEPGVYIGIPAKKLN